MGAAGVELLPVAMHWPSRVDVAIVGGGITGLLDRLPSCGERYSGRCARSPRDRERRLRPGLRSARPVSEARSWKIIADLGEERGTRLSDAVANAPAEVAAFIERYQIACAATRTGILIGARTEAGRRQLEATAAALPARPRRYSMARTLPIWSAATSIRPCCWIRAASISIRSPMRAGIARAASAHGALIHPGARASTGPYRADPNGISSGPRQLTAAQVIIATNAYSGSIAGPRA